MAFKCQRWTLANILPVMFVTWIITTIWFLYLWLHLSHLLTSEDAGLFQQGIWQAVASQLLFAIFAVCFVRAIMTDPGSVPQTVEWSGRSQASQAASSTSKQSGESSLLDKPKSNEVKVTGERRFCKWCDQYKPDRCHHCRVCRSCILRMDHHCPWIANCVGFQNHKYFFLLVFYAFLNCLFVIGTMWASIMRAADDEMLAWHRFLIVFGMTLAVIMCILLKLFFCIHVVLMLRAQTTIEYCEKRQRRTVSYDAGLMVNLKASLGPNPLLWLLPCNPPEGLGTHFQTAPKPFEEEPTAVSSQEGCKVPLASASAAAPAEATATEVLQEKVVTKMHDHDGSEPEVTGGSHQCPAG